MKPNFWWVISALKQFRDCFSDAAVGVQAEGLNLDQVDKDSGSVSSRCTVMGGQGKGEGGGASMARSFWWCNTKLTCLNIDWPLHMRFHDSRRQYGDDAAVFLIVPFVVSVAKGVFLSFLPSVCNTSIKRFKTFMSIDAKKVRFFLPISGEQYW